MKKAVLLSVLILLCILTLAQVPESFNYQAVVRDESNSPITDQAVSFKMSILEGSILGDAVYSELHSTTTNSIGLVNLVIGNGTDKVGDISSIDWGADSYYLKVEIDPTGGTDYTLMGVTQLLSVPYAFHAKTAETVTEEITENDPVYSGSESANITSADITNLSNLSGTNTGDQNLTDVLAQGTDAGNKSIVNVSQQGIGTSTPDVSAALDITSTTKGFLPPRLTTVAIKAILRPAEGLVVYNLDTKALNVFDGTMWADMTGVAAFPLELGDTYAGGIIFYIDGTGKHGLVCASTDQGSLIQWYNNDFYSTTGATGTAVGTGQSNTTAIVTDQGEGSYAAILCDDLVLNTFSDWFLPSKDELDLMYTNLKLNGFGGFTDEYYWSSSEESVYNAWSQYFGNGDVWIDLKTYHYFVRAVRAF